ncbi:MAG TPA: N-acetylmuramoyl-L-alanine amidase [Terriglobales bacterium]|nr:N-acetylmuramoyl-L-alanine amidase [Terriglobales bacterium]
MIWKFPVANRRWWLWLGPILPVIGLVALIPHFAIVQAQGGDQLTVYSRQTTYSVALLEVKGQPYAGLVEVLEPLGSVDARADGKKYKLKFTPPGGHAVAAEFRQGKNKAKVLGENYKLSADFVLQNSHGYVPLTSVPEILNRLLAKPVQLHAAARRLFVGDVGIRFTLAFDKSAPPKLLVSFPAPVNPTIATEEGRVRFTFRREPVVSNGQDSVNFNNPLITGAVFREYDGLAELDVTCTQALMANFADGGKTIVVTAMPPPQPAQPEPTPQPQAPPQAATPRPSAPAAPRFLVILDPAHGGADTGAVITSSLLEKDVVLALARRVQHDLAARGIAATLLRNSDVAIPLDQRAVTVNAARPALYIALHAANTGRGVHVFTSLLPVTDRPRNSFLPWSTAQAAFLDLSDVVAGSVAAELENRKLPNMTLVAPLRPMNNIAAPAIAVEIAPPDDKVEDIESADYQEQVAQSVAAGIAAVRSKLPEVRP